jgi:hypothetical protein
MSDDIKALKEALASVPSGAYVLPGIDAHKLARLLGGLEAAEMDASRYRWLRKADGDWGICEWDGASGDWVRDSRSERVVDAAIDAAMKKEPQQ